MIKVTSLKRRIVVQFLALLLPVLALLALQTVTEVHRNAVVQSGVEAHGKAGALRDAYRSFVDGAADAVDSGVLAKSRVADLQAAAVHLRELAALDPERAPSAVFIDTLERLHASLAADPGVANLQRWRDTLVQARQQVEALYAGTENTLDQAIADALVQSALITRVVVVAALVVLGVAVLFVLQMIRGLTEPLEVAVRVANRISEGAPIAAADFETRADIDNLLGSLQRMSGSLDNYRDESLRHRRGLEEKVEQLDRSQRSLAEAQQLAHLGNWSWVLDQAKPHWSDEMYRVLGLAPRRGAGWRQFVSSLAPESRDDVRAEFMRLRAAPRRFSLEHRVLHADGIARTVIHQGGSEADADGRIVRLFGMVQDITERKQAEDQIRKLALFDPLTRLPNRRYFKEHVRRAIERAQRAKSTLAVMFIDLDRFKRINDTLGHSVGDELLREVAERIGDCVRGGDLLGRDSVWADDLDEVSRAEVRVVARLGGDEFTVLLSNMRHSTDAARVARRITERIAAPLLNGGNELFVTASIGIAVFPDDGGNVDLLLRHADAAMYEAKRQGKNTFQFFTSDLHAAAFEKLKIEKELRRAIERDQFVLHYQPKVDTQSGAITGVEALIRWQHPEWGLVAPGTFIPVAEEAGLIVAVGDWVLTAACRQLAAWRDAGLPALTMAINLASPSFRQPALVQQIRAELARWRLPPACLVIEVTESLLMHDVEATLPILHELRALGVHLSIDDFGTGYSSLSYLQRFPISQLKVDQSFVRHLDENRDHAAIAKAVITLGRALELETVAEGVENAAQAAMLSSLRCTMLQGYFFSRPLPADEIAQLLRAPAPFRRQMAEMLDRLPTPSLDTVT